MLVGTDEEIKKALRIRTRWVAIWRDKEPGLFNRVYRRVYEESSAAWWIANEKMTPRVLISKEML